MARQLQYIAYEISGLWKARPTKGNYQRDARPYLRAMFYLVSVNDTYRLDSGRDIVRRFLINSAGWRGEDARRIKAELEGMLKCAS